MVLKDDILENVEKLPLRIQKEILHYSEYLVSRYQQENQGKKSTKRGGLGILKGKIIMSEDFDEPLAEMKEYME